VSITRPRHLLIKVAFNAKHIFCHTDGWFEELYSNDADVMDGLKNFIVTTLTQRRVG
jgi:hypothetical protein